MRLTTLLPSYTNLITLLLLLVTGIAHAGFGQSGGLYFMQAEKLRRADKLSDAIVYYDSAIMAEPHNHRFHFEKGKCHVLLNEESHAIRSLEQTIRLRPDHIESYTRLAWLYERKEDYQQVIRCLDNASKYHRENIYKVEYKLRILKTLQLLDRFSEAAAHIEEAKSLAEENSLVYIDILYYEAKLQNMNKEHEKAIATAKYALQTTTSVENHHVAKFYYELGYAYYKKGEYRNARAAFTYAKQDEFKPLIARLSPDFNYALAAAYFKVHQYDACEEAINKCLSFDKDYGDAHRLRKEMQSMRGNFGAIKARKTLIALESNPEAKIEKLIDLSFYQMGADQPEQAVKSLDSCLMIKPQYWRAVMLKGGALWKSGRIQQAKQQLHSIIDAVGTSGEVGAQTCFILGLIYKEEKDFAKARKYFQNAKSGLFNHAAEYEIFGLKSQ